MAWCRHIQRQLSTVHCTTVYYTEYKYSIVVKFWLLSPLCLSLRRGQLYWMSLCKFEREPRSFSPSPVSLSLSLSLSLFMLASVEHKHLSPTCIFTRIQWFFANIPMHFPICQTLHHFTHSVSNCGRSMWKYRSTTFGETCTESLLRTKIGEN